MNPSRTSVSLAAPWKWSLSASHLVRELAAADTRSWVSVAVVCKVLDFSKQAYYQWLRNPVSDRDWDEAHPIDAARDVWDEDRCQGDRLIKDVFSNRIVGCSISDRMKA